MSGYKVEIYVSSWVRFLVPLYKFIYFLKLNRLYVSYSGCVPVTRLFRLGFKSV